MPIIECNLERLSDCCKLFDKYREFYDQPSDIVASSAFLARNFEDGRSLILLAIDDEWRTVGFAQLYPMFCSISMKPMYYLSDLFVEPDSRKKGHARALLDTISNRLGPQGIQRVSLETARTNTSAINLYESVGYQRELEFIAYSKFFF